MAPLHSVAQSARRRDGDCGGVTVDRQPVDLVAALDRVDDGVLTLDRNGRVRFANLAATKLLDREGYGSTFDLRVREALTTQSVVEFEEYLEVLGAWCTILVYPRLGGTTVVFRDSTRLHALMAERRTLLDRLLQAEDRERSRIAGDIHDDSAQALVVVALRLELLRAELGVPSPAVSALLDSLGEQVASATAGLRTLLFSLEPTDPDAPLVESIRTHAAHLFDGSSIHWVVDDVDGGAELPAAERSHALRITKEALNNAHAHARATEVVVTIVGRDDGVEISIADDGPAVDPRTFTSSTGHRGLATMRDRAAAVGGLCEMAPSSPHGCTVRVYVPRRR